MKYSWWWCITRHPVRYGIIVSCMLLALPTTLMLPVLAGNILKQLQTTPTVLSWVELLGQHASRWVRPLLQGSELADGISVSTQMKYFPLLLMAVAFINSFLRGTMEYQLENVGEKVTRELRIAVFSSFTNRSYRSATKVPEGILASMVGEDTREIRLTFTRMAGTVIADSLLAIVLLAWLILLDTQLFLLFFSVLFPTGLVIRISGKKLKQLSRMGLEYQSTLLGALLERLRGWQTIQIHKAFSFELKRFDALNDLLYHNWRRATRARALSSPLVEWLATVAAAMVAYVALRRIADDAITASVFSSFIATVVLLANSLQNLTSQFNVSKKGLESLRRIQNFLADDTQIQRGSTRSSSQTIEKIELKELIVGNSETGAPLTTPLNLTLKVGDICAVCGPSGAGKSTLLRVLMGLEKPHSGQCLINNQEPDEEMYNQLANSIAFIPQEVFLFDSSVAENLVYPEHAQKLSETQTAKVDVALDLANLQKLPTDSVNGISGGERQRLAFARTFFRNPTLVLIDEGTSALDLPNERLLLERIAAVAKNKIVVIIAHRPQVREIATAVLDLSLLTS